MFRKTGAIPQVIKDRYPSRLVVFDTEAWRVNPGSAVEYQTLRLGVARSVTLEGPPGETASAYYNFTTCEQLGEWLEYQTRKDQALYVYAHNLKYDLQLSGLYTWLVDQGWLARIFVAEDPPTFIKLKRGRMSMVFVDTFNYWQFSLSTMGQQLGLPKLDVDFDQVSDQELLTYCKRDVDVLTEYLLNFISFLRENDLCGLGLTLASQAFRAYRHKFMSTEIVLHNRANVLKLEREGYMGGRVDCFFLGDPAQPDYYKLDVNSMYPYVMREYTYPVEFVAYAEHVPLDRLAKLSDKYYLLAQVELETDYPSYAYRGEVKLLFPVGRFVTVLHDREIQRAMAYDEIRQVLKLAIYKTGDVFSQYVDFFYQLKLQADHDYNQVVRQQAKIMLNSLYGKFGQQGVRSKILPTDGYTRFAHLTGYSETLRRVVEVNYLGNVVEMRYKDGEAFYSSPVIAGAVTAYARGYLWELVELAGVANVYYMDTDSLIVTRAGYDKLTPLIDPDKLGYLKLEGETDTLFINGVKDYIFGDEVKLKGVPHKSFTLDNVTYQYSQFRGFKSWINQGMRPGMEVYQATRARQSSYDKGILQADGRVLPLRFGLGGEH